MTDADLRILIGDALSAALQKKGFTELTPVQRAVLEPRAEGRDLRISSQTGSGKTVAVGLALRRFLEGEGAIEETRALVLAPTRELAKQVKSELAWLYEGLPVAVVTGGSSYRDELRALSAKPVVVVGTPGRVLDHLDRKSLVPDAICAVVLDEADQMLDLGFREALLDILGRLPAERTTHLVSATFPGEVESLANQVQREPVRVEGTPLGSANADIDHVLHIVSPFQRTDAVVNLLLASPAAPTLVFARTRADVARVATELGQAGFRVSPLSGDMEQPERERALGAFKRGGLDALVATDVAARGIDVEGIARVVHMEPPLDPDTYTHRSGRTGRAGKKGVSSVLVAPSTVQRTLALLRRARVSPRFEPIPSAEAIRGATEARLLEELLAPAGEERAEPDDRAWDLAKRIFAHAEAKRAMARLLFQAKLGPSEPREVRAFDPPSPKSVGGGAGPRGFGAGARPGPARRPGATGYDDRPRRGSATAYAERPKRGEATGYGERGAATAYAERPRRGEATGYGERGSATASAERPKRGEATGYGERPMGDEGVRRRAAPREHGASEGAFVTFRVTWGAEQGADPRRLLASVCRRGDIRGADVGSIRMQARFSLVDVAREVADRFEANASAPDPRDPRVRIFRADERPTRPAGGPPRAGEAPTRPAPYPKKKPPRPR